jgi:putative transposase
MAWQPRQLTDAQKEDRRRAAARLLRTGNHSQASIARQLGVSRTAVTKWKHQLDRAGVRGLKAVRRTGRKPKLTAEQTGQLKRLLRRGAINAGFPTERWTLGRIQTLIKREFGVEYHVKYVGRLMRRMGWSAQQPETRALERDETLIRAWFEHDWPRIKQSLAARRGNRVPGCIWLLIWGRCCHHLGATWPYTDPQTCGPISA